MFKFYALETDKGDIEIRDVSNVYDRFPPKIKSFLLDIKSAKLTNGNILNIDILHYLKFDRKDNEIFTITNKVLGLNDGSSIPDGVYHLTFKINNDIEEKIEIAYIRDITNKINKLAESIDYSIDVEDNTLFTNNLPFDAEISKIHYIIAVYYKLIVSLNSNNITLVNDLIDKLQRLLLIVK